MSEPAPTAASTAEAPSDAGRSPPPVTDGAPAEYQPSYVFFGIVAAVCLLLDVISKAWAEVAFNSVSRGSASLVLIEDHLRLTLAYNPGGAWGMLQRADESIRRPFFVAVSGAAVVFIISLYSKLTEGQRALKWGLPLVLGGALGNLADRIVRSNVIDFIDYRADWVRTMNEMIAAVFTGWNVTDHWPTFNVADIAICAGVALMGIDMITSRRQPEPPRDEPDSVRMGTTEAAAPPHAES